LRHPIDPVFLHPIQVNMRCKPALHSGVRSALAAILVFAVAHFATPVKAEFTPDPSIVPYSGPLFDAMAQTDETLDGNAMYATAKAAGVTRMALFARIHRRHDGSALVDHLAAAHPDFFIVGAPKYFDMRDDLDASFVSSTRREISSGHARFVGEILYSHGDKEGGEVTATGERYIDPTRPNTAKLLTALKGKQIPFMAHWEVYDWERDWPRFHKLYEEFPQQIFILPHAGLGSAEQLAYIMQLHPNVWATLSKREHGSSSLRDEDKAEDVGPSVIDRHGRLRPEWRDVMIRFHDRLMFATDCHNADRWPQYREITVIWRQILAQLPPDVAQEIAYGNAVRLYGK